MGRNGADKVQSVRSEENELFSTLVNTYRKIKALTSGHKIDTEFQTLSVWARYVLRLNTVQIVKEECIKASDDIGLQRAYPEYAKLLGEVGCELNYLLDELRKAKEIYGSCDPTLKEVVKDVVNELEGWNGNALEDTT